MLSDLVVSLKKKSNIDKKENQQNINKKEDKKIPDYVSGGW